MSGEPVEVWFYHLERSGLEEVLAPLLDRTLQRGWRALVRSGDPARLPDLDSRLWTVRPDVVAPHGLSTELNADRQPVVLTADAANPNGAHALFLVHGAEAGALDGFARVLDLFDGRDPAATSAARGRWKALKGTGAALSYWTPDGCGTMGEARVKPALAALGVLPLLGGCLVPDAPFQSAASPASAARPATTPDRPGRPAPPSLVYTVPHSAPAAPGDVLSSAPEAAAPKPAAPVDTCGAAELGGLVGKLRTEIPIASDLSRRRVVCSGCPVDAEVRPDRQTITYDGATHLVTKVSCG